MKQWIKDNIAMLLVACAIMGLCRTITNTAEDICDELRYVSKASYEIDRELNKMNVIGGSSK